MSPIFFMLVGALCISISNLFMRKSIDAGGSSKGFLLVQFFAIFLISILLNPVREHNYSWNTPMALLGLIGGVLLSVMMFFLGKALQRGAPGITFALLNASSVVPALVLSLIFGSVYGYSYHPQYALGSLLVVFGLFFATGFKHFSSSFSWFCSILTAFTAHVTFLVLLSFRSLWSHSLLTDPSGFLLSLPEIKGYWFMPSVFLTAFILQICIWVFSEKRALLKQEIWYGGIGGLLNGMGTYFMIKATEIASSVEQGYIYPLFSVAVIIISNLWGRYLYKEKIAWVANICCALGVIIAMLA